MMLRTRGQERLVRRAVYGDNNELKQVSIPDVGAISSPSYTWNRPDRISYPGGGTRTFTYDPLMRLRRLLARDPGGNALLDVQYQYDRLNNILTKTTPQGTVNYTYDAILRLTDVQVETPTAGQPDEGFTYDRVGNRTTEARIEGEWDYNANNELLSFATTEYSYDANGNTTQVTLDGTILFSYYYNTFDRLVQVDDVNENTIAEYYYDPFGRRLWKQAGGQTTLFFYSDEGLVAEYDASGAEMRSYGYRPDATWTTDPLWLKQEGEYYFYHNDHLGTPRKLVQQNGAVVWSASYTAFGQATVEVATVTNNLRFPGQYYDVETGLHYNYFRYYAPGIGRYLRIDPIGFEGGDNLFTYVQGNPVRFIDQLGLVQCCYDDCLETCRDALVPSFVTSTTISVIIATLSEVFTGLGAATGLHALTVGGAVAGGAFFAAVGSGLATGAWLMGGYFITTYWLVCPAFCSWDPCLFYMSPESPKPIEINVGNYKLKVDPKIPEGTKYSRGYKNHNNFQQKNYLSPSRWKDSH